jgi:hypothetical protein
MIADPAGTGGRLHRHTHTGSAATLSTLSNNVTSAAAGDVMEISGTYSSDGGTTVNIVLTVTATQSISRIPVSNLIPAITGGTYKQQFTCPAGTSSVRVTLTSGVAGGPNTGVVDFSYPLLRNLTQEGGSVL